MRSVIAHGEKDRMPRLIDPNKIFIIGEPHPFSAPNLFEYSRECVEDLLKYSSVDAVPVSVIRDHIKEYQRQFDKARSNREEDRYDSMVKALERLIKEQAVKDE